MSNDLDIFLCIFHPICSSGYVFIFQADDDTGTRSQHAIHARQPVWKGKKKKKTERQILKSNLDKLVERKPRNGRLQSLTWKDVLHDKPTTGVKDKQRMGHRPNISSPLNWCCCWWKAAIVRATSCAAHLNQTPWQSLPHFFRAGIFISHEQRAAGCVILHFLDNCSLSIHGHCWWKMYMERLFPNKFAGFRMPHWKPSDLFWSNDRQMRFAKYVHDCTCLRD